MTDQNETEVTDQTQTTDAPMVSDDDALRLKTAHRHLMAALAVEAKVKAAFKAAKERSDELQGDLNAILAEVLDGQGRLFDLAPVEADETPGPWQQEPIDGLDVPERAKGALLAMVPPISTVGELSAWMEKHGEHWAADITGIGQKARELVEEALVTFWAEHPRSEPEPEFAKAVLGEEDDAEDDSDGPGPDDHPSDPDPMADVKADEIPY